MSQVRAEGCASFAQQGLAILLKRQKPLLGIVYPENPKLWGEGVAAVRRPAKWLGITLKVSKIASANSGSFSKLRCQLKEDELTLVPGWDFDSLMHSSSGRFNIRWCRLYLQFARLFSLQRAHIWWQPCIASTTFVLSLFMTAEWQVYCRGLGSQ